MKKVVIYGMILFLLVVKNVDLQARNSHVFIDRMLISNSIATSSANPLLPLESVDIITDQDELIYYVANLGVINPIKNRYDADIICVDSNDHIVLKKTVKSTLSGYEYNLDGDTIKGTTYTLKLNPRLGLIGQGQLKPLKKGENYFIKLFFDKKLVGITKFKYINY